jgi:DNA-binding LacI/PurR family transcriptional regulator
MITLKMVARRAGVSEVTVCNVLNRRGREGEASAATAKKIRRIAERMGYVPNYAARRLTDARFHPTKRGLDRVGFMLLADKEAPLQASHLEFFLGVETEVAGMDSALLFLRTHTEESWRRGERLVRSGGVDGLIVAGSVPCDALERIASWKCPLVVIGRQFAGAETPWVDADYQRAGYLGMKRLAEQGHRRIAVATVEPMFYYQRKMMDGVRKAVKECDLDRSAELIHLVSREVLKGLSGYERKRRAMAELSSIWKLSPRPTAAFYPEPMSPMYLFSLREMLGIPRGVSAVIATMEKSEDLALEFGRVEIPCAVVGEEAVRVLRRVMAGDPSAKCNAMLAPSFA